MNKYPCQLIEDLLPLYLDGDVSEETRKIVTEHLEACNCCRTLVRDFAAQQPVLNNIEEKLPHIETFKNLMSQLKRVGIIAIFTLVIMVTVVGTLCYQAGTQRDNGLLTLREVTTAFQTDGIQLTGEGISLFASPQLGGVRPHIYKVGNTDDRLFVYVFNTIEEQQKIFESFNSSDKYHSLFAPRYTPMVPIMFQSHNVLFVYTPRVFPKNTAQMQLWNKIGNLVFTKLNNGQTLVFTGVSNNWRVQYVIKYYEYWWKDSTGRMQYINEHNDHVVLKYLGKDLHDVGPISYDLAAPNGSMGGTGFRLDKNGYYQSGGGGNGALTRRGDLVTATVKWNGQQESYILRAK